jgi:hypothetical protein
MTARERIATAPSDRSSRQTSRPVEVLSAGRVLTFDEVERWQAVAFDCNGAARNLDLPAEELYAGAFLLITNATAATHALTVRNDAAGTVVAVPAATVNRSARVWCDGSAGTPSLGRDRGGSEARQPHRPAALPG